MLGAPIIGFDKYQKGASANERSSYVLAPFLFESRF